MSEVRRASPNGLPREEIADLLSGDSGEITDLEIIERYPATGYDAGYPFEDQTVILGEFIYQDDHPFSDGSRSVPVDFMFREDSRLFIFNTGQQSNVNNEILRALNSNLPADTRLRPDFGGSRSEIWDFIRKASRKNRIRVWHDDSLVDTDELDMPEEELTDKLVWDAEIYFEHPETGEEDLVIYNEESLSVAVESLSEIEHIIQAFEQTLLN